MKNKHCQFVRRKKGDTLTTLRSPEDCKAEKTGKSAPKGKPGSEGKSTLPGFETAGFRLRVRHIDPDPAYGVSLPDTADQFCPNLFSEYIPEHPPAISKRAVTPGSGQWLIGTAHA